MEQNHYSGLESESEVQLIVSQLFNKLVITKIGYYVYYNTSSLLASAKIAEYIVTLDVDNLVKEVQLFENMIRIVRRDESELLFDKPIIIHDSCSEELKRELLDGNHY